MLVYIDQKKKNLCLLLGILTKISPTRSSNNPSGSLVHVTFSSQNLLALVWSQGGKIMSGHAQIYSI